MIRPAASPARRRPAATSEVRPLSEAQHASSTVQLPLDAYEQLSSPEPHSLIALNSLSVTLAQETWDDDFAWMKLSLVVVVETAPGCIASIKLGSKKSLIKDVEIKGPPADVKCCGLDGQHYAAFINSSGEYTIAYAVACDIFNYGGQNSWACLSLQ